MVGWDAFLWINYPKKFLYVLKVTTYIFRVPLNQYTTNTSTHACVMCTIHICSVSNQLQLHEGIQNTVMVYQ